MPNVLFENSLHDYAFACCGATLHVGITVLLDALSNKRTVQAEGAIRLKLLRSMPTLDLRQLDQTALQNAERIFEELKHEKMLPFNQMFEDTVRQELDRRLLSEVLGICESAHSDVYAGLHRVRERLCEEPSIHGGKQSRVVL